MTDRVLTVVESGRRNSPEKDDGCEVPIACPICEATDTTLFMRVKAQLSSRRCYDLVRCETCTHIFLKQHPTDEELREFYSRTYKPYTVVRDRFSKRAQARERLLHWVYGPGSAHNWWARRIRWLLPNYPSYVPNGFALDVGCGAGTILEELKDLGWRCEGIDVARSVKDRLA